MRVVFLTATRADFGKLKPVILALQREMDVRVFVTGMHMLSRYGSTYREVLRAGVDQPFLFSNQRVGDPMDYVLARTIQGLGDYLKENRVDLIVVHGDRVEAMAGALAGALHNILVVHIEGGEVSGTVDEHLRHAVTKLAHLHFVANEQARERVLQLGERPETVHVTGSPDLDVMSSPHLPTLEEARERYEIAFPEFGICIFHPVTTEVEASGSHAREVMAALVDSGRHWVVIHPNNDHGCEAILEVYRRYENHQRLRFFPSIRFEYFLTLMKSCRLMVGNSSAGVREIPFYGRYALNVGTRQNNRTSSSLVINAPPERDVLTGLIDTYWGRVGTPSRDFGDGKSTERILEIFRTLDRGKTSIQKVFRDISTGTGEEGIGMNEMETELRELKVRLVSSQLEEQFQRNRALFEAVLPEAAEMVRDHEPTVMYLHYDDGGFVNLMNALDGSPVYPGDPREFARAQVAEYRKNAWHLTGANQRTNVLNEEDNAHLFHSNQVAELLLDNPQERMEELPELVSFMLLLGLGLGYQLEALLEAAEIRNLCIVEPEVDSFLASLHTVDWAPVIEYFSRPGYSLELIVGRSLEEACREINAFLDDIGPFHAALPFIFEHLKGDKLAQALRDFTRRIMPLQFVAQGYFDDEQVGLAHSLANFRRGVPVLQAPDQPGVSPGRTPAFLVANGPSLDGAVDFLRRNGSRGVIFSCGTALGSLTKAGVKPDFHVEMERSRPVVEWIGESTSEEDRRGIRLLGLNTVHPEVFDLFPEGGMGMKPNDAGTLFLSRYAGPGSRVSTLESCNPTVGNAALAFVNAMGFSELYLFGLDLGFPSGTQHHSFLSPHYGIPEEHRSSLGLYGPDEGAGPRGPGNFGGEVVTTEVYLRAKWEVEKVLRANPALRCFNASGGLLIRGATPVRVDDIRLRGEAAGKASLSDRLFRLHFGNSGLEPLRPDHEAELRTHVLGVLDSLRELGQVPVLNRGGGLDMLRSLHDLMEAQGQDPVGVFVVPLLKGSVRVFCALMSQALHRHQDAGESLELFGVAREHFLAFLEAARKVAENRFFFPDTRTRNLAGLIS